MKIEAKVGIFIFIGIIFLFFMTTQVNDLNITSKKDFRISGLVSNIAGLEKNAKVKINGLDVGFVQSFEMVDDKVKINMVLKKVVKIPKDSTIMLAQSSMLSGKFVEISLGTATEYISEELPLTNEKIYATFDKTSDTVDQAANEVKLFISELREMLNSGTREDVQDSIKNIKSFTQRLDKLIDNNDELLSETLHNFNEMALDLADAGKSFGTMSNKFSHTADSVNEQLPDILDKFKTIENNLDNTILNINGTVKHIDNVITENKEPLKETIASAKKFFSDGGDAFGKIDQYFDSVAKSVLELSLRGEFQTDDAFVKSYLSIQYNANPTKFYLLELVSTNNYTLNNGIPNSPDTHDKSKNLVTAQFGKRFNDVVFRGGITESTGGVGIDYLTKKDKLKATLELYDFNAINDARGENPHAKISVRYNVLKHMDFYAGYDNFLNNESANVFAGVGIRFIDDDIKSLVGSVGGSLIK